MATPVVKIVQMERLKIIVNATEEDLGKLAVDQEAHIRVRSYPAQAFLGKVTKISPILDPVTRMADIEIMLDNKENFLKPGMYAEVQVVTGILENVIVVPRYATIENTTMENIGGKDEVVKNYYVYIVSDDKAKQVKLDVSYVNHNSISVDSALSLGDTLVVSGQNNLRNGIAVKIAKEKGDEL